MIHISYTVASTYKGNLRMDQDQIFHTFNLQTVPLVLKAFSLFTIHYSPPLVHYSDPSLLILK